MFLLAGLLAAVGCARAQGYAELSGIVIDASRSGVPHAFLAALNSEKRIYRRALTNESGFFVLANLEPGTYTVTVQKDGFRPLVTNDLRINPGDAITSEFRLAIAGLSGSIDVPDSVDGPGEARFSNAQDVTSAVNYTITSSQFRNAPLAVSRSLQMLLVAVPGFLPPDTAGVNSNMPAGAATYSANGASASLVTYSNDGAVSRNAWLEGQSAYVPTTEAVEELSVVSGGFEADQGYAGTAAVNLRMRSGTNNRHGSLVWDHSDHHLKARPYYLPPGPRQNKQISNQFGASLGGPIIKDRLFYFASFERTSDRVLDFGLANVPSAAMRGGDLSVSPTTIYDPLSAGPGGAARSAFPGQVIPASRINPIVRKVIALIPQSNFGNASAAEANYYASGPWSFDRNKLDTKFTWNATDRLRVNTRISALSFSGSAPSRYGLLEGNRIGNKGGYTGDSDGWQVSQTHAATYTFSAYLLVDGSFSTHHQRLSTTPFFSERNLGLDYLQIPGTNSAGVPGANTSAGRAYGGWPKLQINGYTTFGRGSIFDPNLDTSSMRQFSVNASWMTRAHNVRFGGGAVRAYLDRYEPTGDAGQFYFTNGITELAGQPAGLYNGWASFLLGLPQSIAKTAVWSSANAISPNYSLYLRDRWQVSGRLTLTAGLRWEYYSPPMQKDGKGFPIYDPASDVMTLCGWGRVPVSTCGFTASKRGFAPSAGAAYRFSRTFSVRAGYGISWDPSNVARNAAKWFPSSSRFSQSGESTYDYVSSISAGLPGILRPEIGNGTLLLPPNYDVGLLDPKLRREYVQSWNLMFQKNLGAGWAAEAGYVANRGRHVTARWDFNYSSAGGGNQSRVLYDRFGLASEMRITTDLGRNTQFDSLQSTLRRQFSKGYTLQLSYSLRRTFSDQFTSFPNPRYWGIAKHVPDVQDRPHGLTAMALTALPFGEGKRWVNRGFAAKALGGWQAGGILCAFSGMRFTVGASGSSLNAPGHLQLADQIKPQVQVYGNPDRWFDTAAYSAPVDARFGNSGVNQLRGPSYVNLNLNLSRKLRLTDLLGMEVQVDALNATNTPHFSVPQTNANNPETFGRITSVMTQMSDGIDERMFRIRLRMTF